MILAIALMHRLVLLVCRLIQPASYIVMYQAVQQASLCSRSMRGQLRLKKSISQVRKKKQGKVHEFKSSMQSFQSNLHELVLLSCR